MRSRPGKSRKAKSVVDPEKRSRPGNGDLQIAYVFFIKHLGNNYFGLDRFGFFAEFPHMEANFENSKWKFELSLYVFVKKKQIYISREISSDFNKK